MLIASCANTASANNVHFNVLNKNRMFMLLVSVSQIKPHYSCVECRTIERTRGEAEMFYEDYSWKCQRACTLSFSINRTNRIGKSPSRVGKIESGLIKEPVDK